MKAVSQKPDPRSIVAGIDAQLDFVVGFERCLAPGCVGMAPIMSWVGRQSKTVEHYYRYSASGTALHALLHALFYATERVEFTPSKKADRIARYLTPRAIGVLAGAVGSRIASSGAAIDARRVVDLICGDRRLRDTLDRQTAVHRRATELASQALALFERGKAEIEAMNHALHVEREAFNRDSARRNTIYDTVMASAPPDVKAQMRAGVAAEPPAVDPRQVPRVSERQAVMAYHKSAKERRAAARSARQALFEKVLETASPEIQAEYAELSARIASHAKREQDLSRQVTAVRDAVTDRIKAAWEEVDPERSFSSQYMKFKHAGRYFDDYVETLLATMRTDGALETDLPALAEAVVGCAEASSGSNERPLALAALTLLLAYRINSAADVQEYLEGIAAAAPQCLTVEGHALLGGCAGDENAKTRDTGDVETIALEAFLTAHVGSVSPLLASTRYANVTASGRLFWFPDCGESNLRNFLNLILYQRTTQTYQWRRLTALDLTVSPGVIDFYKRNPKVADTCAQRVHDDWATTLSNLSASIEYLAPFDAPVCEVGPGAANMTAVFKVLFGSDDLERIISELAGVNPEIQRIDISRFDCLPEGPDGTNSMTIHYEHSTVEWEFSKRHYRMYERINAPEQSQHELHLRHLMARLSESCGAATALLILGPVLRKMTMAQIQDADWFRPLSPSDTLQAMLSARIDWADDFEAVALAGMRHPALMSDRRYRASIEKLALAIAPYGGGQEIRNRLAQQIEENGFAELAETASLLRSIDSYAAYAG